MQPYLLALCERDDNLKLKKRSVLTAVHRIGPFQTLFVTCRHAVQDHTKLFLVDEAGTIVTNRWTVFQTSEIDLDLSFALVLHDVPANQIKVNESPIHQEIHLSH